jgi:photosystem II stability/assembly factor-like uncharacterized protein
MQRTAFLLVTLCALNAAQTLSWSPFSGGLPETPPAVRAIGAFDVCPFWADCWGSEEFVVAGTDSGIYGRSHYRDGSGQSDLLWQQLSEQSCERLAINNVTKAIFALNHQRLRVSRDFGKTWTTVLEANRSTILQRGLAVCGSDSNLVYCSDAWWNGMSAKVLKSTDGGSSWTDCDAGLNCSSINDLVVYPSGPETLFVATDSGLFSSRDGGKSFESVFSGYEVSSIAINPRDPLELMLGTSGDSRSHGFYHSTDGGTNWKAYRYAIGNLHVAFDPYTPHRAFFAEADSSQSRTPLILVRTEQQGQATPLTTGAYFDCVNCFGFSSLAPNDVWAGTVSHGVLRLVQDISSVAPARGGLTPAGRESMGRTMRARCDLRGRVLDASAPLAPALMLSPEPPRGETAAGDGIHRVKVD